MQLWLPSDKTPARRFNDAEIVTVTVQPDDIRQHVPQRALSPGTIPSVHLLRAFAAQKDESVPQGWMGSNRFRHRLSVAMLFLAKKSRLTERAREPFFKWPSYLMYRELPRLSEPTLSLETTLQYQVWQTGRSARSCLTRQEKNHPIPIQGTR
jgi:hypothetical protein